MAAWTTNDIPDQSGRVAVVTGANSGLGYQVALALAVAGAEVVLACRNAGKAQSALASIRAQAPAARVCFIPLDLGDLASIDRFAVRFSTEHDQLNLLVNNAGLMAVDQSRTADGFETQPGVNHLGHFALTARLTPALLSSTGARIASMSSMAHRGGRLGMDDLMFDRRRYGRWVAYGQSKLANLLFVLGAATPSWPGWGSHDRVSRPPARSSHEPRFPGARHRQPAEPRRASLQQAICIGGAPAAARLHGPRSGRRALLRAPVGGFRPSRSAEPQFAGP